MLFRFTDEQKKELHRIENKLDRASAIRLIYSGAITDAETGRGKDLLYAIPSEDGDMVPTDLHTFDDNGNVIPENVDRLKKELDKIPNQRAQLNKQFTDTLNQYAADHVSALKTPADIVADAKQTTSDFLAVLFVVYYRQYEADHKEHEDNSGDIPDAFKDASPEVLSFFRVGETDQREHVMNIEFTQEPYSWNYEREIKLFSKAEKGGKMYGRTEDFNNPPVLFDRESLFRWIEGNVINDHLDRLADDQKETEELLKDVRSLIEAEPFTEVNPKSKAFWKKIDEAAAETDQTSDTSEAGRKYKAKRADKYTLDVSAPGLAAWNVKPEKNNRYQLKTNVQSEKERRKKPREIDIFYVYDFSKMKGITISKEINNYDRLVYTAIASLRDAGNYVFTDRQIFYLIEGEDKRPAPNQLQRIRDSIEKMSGIRIEINNDQESQAYKSKPNVNYKGFLLPIEELQNVSINGNITAVAYHILENKLPMIDVPKARGQVSTASVTVLQIPLNKSEQNLSVSFYLQTRISREKNKAEKMGIKAESFKILFSTLYDHTQITSRKQRQRLPEKITAIMNHFQKVDFIDGYHLEKDGIIVDISQHPELIG